MCLWANLLCASLHSRTALRGPRPWPCLLYTSEILPNLRMGCYMTGGYLVEAKLRGIEAYVYFYLPADAAPSYL